MLSLPMVGAPGGWEWVILVLVFVLLFGASKLPALARETGRALRIFKAETRGLRADVDDDSSRPSGPGHGTFSDGREDEPTATRH